MDWKKYEEITKYIYETLGKQAGVEIIGWGNNFKVRGISDVEHQIDILTSHSDGIHKYLTDIECKYWDQKVNKDTLMKVHSIVEDCKFNKGVVVSKLGFTEDGIKYAKSVNIGLVELREPTDKDWEGRIKTIEITANLFFPEITKFEQFVKEIFIDMDHAMIDTNDYIYHFEDGTQKTVKMILDEFSDTLRKEKSDEEKTITIKFPNNTVLKDISDNKIAIIDGIKLSGKLSKTVQKTVINAENNVWLMMKSLFEGKTYIVSKDGIIRDVSK